MLLTGVHPMVDAVMPSRHARSWWDMPAAYILHHIAIALIQGARHIPTRAITAASRARVLIVNIDEVCCPRLRAVLHGIPHHCSYSSLGIGCPISTLLDRTAGHRRHAAPRSFPCSSLDMTGSSRPLLPHPSNINHWDRCSPPPFTA